MISSAQSAACVWRGRMMVQIAPSTNTSAALGLALYGELITVP
jgi:hypothetical protein